MSKHTPGPWRLKSEPYEDGTPYHVIKAGEGLWAEEPGDGFNFDVIASDADARLLVAAPDLFEALKAMFSVYGKTCSSTLAAQVSDALAKATPCVSSEDGAGR